ncbi:MAG: hypothetical protein IPK67_10185 [Planctomycetes bacterium]|nr:hypothetical protein [Planctomycetota bacterium]
MAAAEPKARRGVGPPGGPSQLHSLAWGLGLGLLGALPACLGAVPQVLSGPENPGSACDEFALLCWIACVAPAAGALAGARGLDLLRFGPVAPALWAAALALVGAAAVRPGLPQPVLGAACWTGLFGLGYGLGAWSGRGLPSAALLLALSALLVGAPGRWGLAGRPWSPPAAAALLDASPFMLLGECSGVRDMAWHRSIYASAGTDRFQREPWSPAPTALAVLGLGIAAAGLGARRRRTRLARGTSTGESQPPLG